jgi:hypothetical protein
LVYKEKKCGVLAGEGGLLPPLRPQQPGGKLFERGQIPEVGGHQPQAPGRLGSGNWQGQVLFHAGLPPEHFCQISLVIVFEGINGMEIDVNLVPRKGV